MTSGQTKRITNLVTTTMTTAARTILESNGDDVNSLKDELNSEAGGGDSTYFDPRFPKSIMIVLLVVGLFGNSLCLFIFSRRHMRKHSTFIYLACLAVVDLVVLSLGLGDIVLIAFLSFVLRSQSLLVCRIVTFLIYTFTHLSSFILASVSIDRAIATNFITFSKYFCRPLTAYKVILFNVALAVGINFHSLFFMGFTTQSPNAQTTILDQDNGTSIDYVNSRNHTSSSSSLQNNMVIQVHCESKKETFYDSFLDPYFKWIDLLAYAIIPFIIMLICTFLIVRVLFRSNRRLNKSRRRPPSTDAKKLVAAGEHHQLKPTSQSLLNNGGSQSASATAAASSTVKSNKALLSNTPAAVAASRSNKAKHLTYTLIILNCLFFCLVGPLLIVLVTLSDQTIHNSKFLINTVYSLAYSNHSFNFILYGVSSPPFRNELFKILGINRSGASDRN